MLQLSLIFNIISETKVNILIIIKNIDIKPKSKYEIRMRNIYTQIVETETQKSHPFGLTESRFTWMKNYLNGEDLKKHKKLFNIKKDNLEGGIGSFFKRIQIENEKEMQQNLLKNCLNFKREKKLKYKYQNINSERVIYPEKDTEIEKVSKKRTYENYKNILLSATNGKISSLFEKTPWIINHKGKKILNKSVDYSRKMETDEFSNSFKYNKENNRIPGIKRKNNVQKISIQIKPLKNIKLRRNNFIK